MSSDIEKGIGNLLGYETPETKRVRDLHYLNKVKQIIERPSEDELLGETLARTTPSLNLEVKQKEETKEPKGFKSQKEYQDHLINSPTKKQHERAYNMGNKILKASEAEKNKMAGEWIRGGGRDPKGRSLDQESKLGKANWKYQNWKGETKPKPMKITNYIDKMNHLYSNEVKNEKTVQQLEALKEYHHPTPVGLGNKYKSDIRTPVQKKRDSYNAKAEDNKAWTEANKPNADTSKGGYVPWFQRMAEEEAEALNEVKRTTWEQGGKVNPEPKYVNAQDVKNVYEPKQTEASPLQVKKLHERLENHNERTGQFKNLPKEEELKHKPRFLHNPVTNELEDTYNPNWGEDILNDKK